VRFSAISGAPHRERGKPHNQVGASCWSLREGTGKHAGILTDFQTKVKKKGQKNWPQSTQRPQRKDSHEKAQKKLATERALDKYKFFVFGLTIATTLY